MDQPNSVVDCQTLRVLNFRMILALGLTMPNGGRRGHGASNHRNEFALRVAIAVNVPLRGLDGAMTGEELDVS